MGYCTAKSNPPTHTALPDSKEEGPPRRINDQRNPREGEEGMGFMNSPSTFFFFLDSATVQKKMWEKGAVGRWAAGPL